MNFMLLRVDMMKLFRTCKIRRGAFGREQESANSLFGFLL
jgi:hypothetical protein